MNDNGKIPITRIISEDEYKKELEKNVLEEYHEVFETSVEDRIENLMICMNY